MSFIFIVIASLAAAISPVAELEQASKVINLTNSIADQIENLSDLQAKNPPCDPTRCY